MANESIGTVFFLSTYMKTKNKTLDVALPFYFMNATTTYLLIDSLDSVASCLKNLKKNPF